MSNSPESSSDQIIPDINSYDGKIMLAAVISLLVVISIVLLLHAYAWWFLGQGHRRRRLSRPISNVWGTRQLHGQVAIQIYDDTHTCFQTTDGLDASIIASLPLFLYKSDEYKNELECIICLSVFEDDEIGRHLPKCQHAFHVECVDMWLQSHSSCPICRAPVALEKSMEVNSISVVEAAVEESIEIEMPPHSSLEYCEVPKHSLQAPTSPSSSMGCSLKRMLSMNRSEPKVFPSSGTVCE